MELDVSDIIWCISARARRDLAREKQTMHLVTYREQRDALRYMLCAYFDSDQCENRALGISPIDGAPDRLKAFKVRWARPGQGKRGGYRMIIVVDCKERHVVVQSIVVRRDGLSDDEAKTAAARGTNLR